MAQASVTIDILAQITGYEASLSKLKAEAAKIDIGAPIGKQLTSAIKQAESALKGLSKNGLEKATNDNQINAIIDKVNRAGQMIQQVSGLMQQINIGDINFGSFNSGIQEMTSQLQALQTQLDATIESGMQKMLTSSQDLSSAFQSLNIDTKGKNIGQLYDELGVRAQQAANRVDQANAQLKKAQENLDNKQSTLKQLEANPLNNRQQFEQELKTLVDSYSTSLSKIKNQVDQKVKGLLGDGKESQNIVDNFFSGLDINNLREHLNNLRIQVQEALKTADLGEMKTTDIFSQIFGGMVDNKAPNAGNLSAQLRGAVQEIENARALVMGKINEASPDFTPSQVGKLIGLFSKDQLDAFVEEFSKDAEKAATKLAGAIVKAREAASKAMTQRNTAQQTADAEKFTQTTITQIQDQLRAENQRLINENKAQAQRITSLQAQINQTKQDSAAGIRGTGRAEMQSAQQLQFGAEAAAKYSAQLQRASQAQQMMGKIQGVVQRWFSIYTVIRAIGTAIRDVTSTIQEIDSTITDIAIVTSQSQDDLWGQMDTYAKMAKDYAASVSGVYKVSQIYYQQGMSNI